MVPSDAAAARKNVQKRSISKMIDLSGTDRFLFCLVCSHLLFDLYTKKLKYHKKKTPKNKTLRIS